MNIGHLKQLSPTTKLFAIITFLLVFMVCVNPPIDPDMWWHLRSGQAMWQQKTILTQDQFSYTKFGMPWVNAFWVSDLLMYFLYLIGGFPLLLTAFALIGTLTYFLIFTRTKGPAFIRSLVVVMAAIATSPLWTLRPQIISFFLLSLLNLWMENRKRFRGLPLYFLPILFVAWVNIHGGFIWGFLLIVATLTGLILDLILHKGIDRIRNLIELKQLALWTTISMVAVLINPNGIAIWRLPFYTIDVSISVIQEWFSPNFHNLEMQPFLWLFFLLIIAYSLTEKKGGYTDIIKTLGFSYMAFVSQRNIPLAVLVIAPIIIGNFTEIWLAWEISNSNKLVELNNLNGSLKSSRIINIFLVFLMIFASFGRVYLQSTSPKLANNFPVEAVKWIRANQPPGQMFNSYNWGGYLLWSLPQYPVFIDGRADLYGNDFIEEWWNIANGNLNSNASMDNYNIHFLLLEPNWPIIEKLKVTGWKVSYQDDIAVVLEK
jgi:hypothetical protein